MVQVINLGPSKSALQAQILGQGLQQLGQGLGEFTANYFADKALRDVMSNPELKDAKLSDKIAAASGALRKFGPRGERILQQHIQMEQQRQQEDRSRILNKIYNDQPLSKGEEKYLDPKDFEMIRKQKMVEKQKPLIRDALINAGMDEQRADALSNIYSQASLGGQTELMKPITDFINRQGHGTKQNTNADLQQSDEQWPEIEEPYKPTPGEEFKRSSKREDTNIPIYNETTKKIHSLEQEGMSIGRLAQLSDQMPEGVFGKANINFKTGELIIPAGASPEVQLYVKTINDFTTKAKDSYGSRVTNFDLSQFMKRLPTLANSKEGRELILKQMEVINDLNLLHEKGYKETFDHYGVGRINSQEARKITDKRIEDKKDELLERYKTLDGLLKKEESTSNNSITMIAPNGKTLKVPQEKVEELEKLGAKRG